MTEQRGFAVEHECPQCGGGVRLGEGERLLACPFCRARLTLWAGDHLRYWIPPGAAAGDDVLLAPYWRMRGLDCALVPFAVHERALDATYAAVAADFLPPTIGVRPQALPLRFAAASTPAFFLETQRTLEDALRRSAALSRAADLATSGAPPMHREFVVATASVVYTPLLVRGDTVFDALLMRELPGCAGAAGDLLGRVERRRAWTLKVCAALCPECGRDLDGTARSVVLFCRACRAGWRAEAAGLQRVACDASAAPAGTVLLPFWRLRATLSVFPLRTGADLVRFANISPGVLKGPAAAPIWFWVPAFAVAPGSFLRVARQMTLAQLPVEEAAPAEADWAEVHSATIGAAEAFGAVKVLLAQIGQPRKEVFPRIAEVVATLEEARLALVAFSPSASDWVEPRTGAAIARSTLRSL